MADILNDTFLTPTFQMGWINRFDSYSYDVGRTEIYFHNSTENYYFNASYYANNGTIREFDGYYLQRAGGEWVTIDMTGKRVFDYDITDEVQWDFDVGDTFYVKSDYLGTGSISKIEITDFRDEVYWSNNWTAYPWDVPMVFETIYGDMSVWNGTHWESHPSLTNITFTAANNFYPMCFPLLATLSSGIGGVFTPISATLDDWKFLINNDTSLLLGNPYWFPYDTVYYNESGNMIQMILEIGAIDRKIISYLNSTSGLIERQIQYDLGSLTMYSEITKKLIDWSVNPGDIIYYKINMDDDFMENRVTVTTINCELFNMTEMETLVNTYGYPLSVPEDQPELQFFSNVEADFEMWDEEDEEWDPVSHPTGILASANEKWPINPYYMFAGSPPLIFPKGTIATDFQDSFSAQDVFYGESNYGTNLITFRNATLDYTNSFYFDGAAGETIYTVGWAYTPFLGEWIYMSMYIENIEHLNPGANSFTLDSDLVTGITTTVDVDVISPVDYIYAVLNRNPINYPVPNGTVLLFSDSKITNYTAIDGNMSMTITFPSTIDLRIDTIYFWAWNVSGTSQWDSPPQEVIDAMIYNYETNSITMEFPITGPYAHISAVSIDYGAPSSPTLSSNADIPTDNDGIFSLSWTEAIGATNYTIYRHSSYITVINSSLTSLATETTTLTHPLTGYTDGTYYFIVVAHNNFGDTLSNCIEVIVNIPSDGEEAIPGYNFYFLLILVPVITAFIIRKRLRKIQN